jgi:signal transduction histidine kinase
MIEDKWCILIVEDDRANLAVMAATFEDHGFAIHAANCVEQAQEILKEHVNTLDLVISDIQMPRLTGFDLVQWMKNQRGGIESIPIQLITSQMSDSENRVKGLSLGAVDYLSKSLDAEELVLRAKHSIENFCQIKSLRNTLEKTECLVSTGRLFAASNHEIKNVAQIIQMAMGILERELNPEKISVSDTGRQALNILSQTSLLLSDITKMIGGLISNTESQLGPVDMDALVNHVTAMVKALLKSEVELSCNSKSSAWVLGSPTFLKQILINLLLNARDAIEEKKENGRGKINISISEVGCDYEVCVIDNGIGFPNDETRFEFEPFASTKQLRGGTGLGLWLSSQLAQKMGAVLSLSSKGLGYGAEAKIRLKKAEL